MEAVITSPVEEHGCGYPDQPCRTCEAAASPPCCHTPNLCGGPHPDCYDALNAEAVGEALGVPHPDAPAVKPLYSGPNGDYTVESTCACLNPDFGGECCGKHEACTHERNRRGAGDRPRNDIVVHISDRRRCCAKDASRPDCT